MMTTIFLVSYILGLYLFGALISSSFVVRNKNIEFGLTEQLSFNLPLGLGVHICCAHLLALATHDFNLSSKIIFALMVLFALYGVFTKKISFPIPKNFDYINIGLALLFALCGAIRGHLTDSDNTHIAWISSIFNNSIYPPVLPVEPKISLNFYHYGVDLTGAAICSITKLMPWDVLSVQVWLGSFLMFLALFTSFKFFTKKNLSSLLMTLIAFFYTSTMSIEFVFRHFPQIIQTPSGQWFQLLKAWQNASLPAVGHIPYFSVLVSQNPAIVCLLIIFMACFIGEKHSLKSNLLIYFSIIFWSFIGYFYYPAYWYPSLTGLILYGFLKPNTRLHYLCIIISMFLGKIASLQFNSTSFGEVKALIWQPSLYWDHFNMNFLYYFGFKPDGYWAKPIIDYVSGKTIFSMHLFALDSFRNFLFITIVALSIAIYLIVRSKINHSFLYLCAGLPALPVPFLFRFVLKPSENYRFLSWLVVMCLIFIVINLTLLMKESDGFVYKLCKPASSQVLISIILIFIMIPGLLRANAF